MFKSNVKYVKKLSLRTRLKRQLRENWILYLMILPVVVYIFIFDYIPMYGIVLAFKEYNPKLGIIGSPLVGFKNFQRLFASYNFGLMLRNTLEISVYSLLVGFTIPIVFAMMLNYVINPYLKKTVQMLSYAPHFLSTVVICSMLTVFMAPETGVFNILREMLGLESLNFLSKAAYFKDIYVWSGVWQGAGWSAIIYISALSGVDQQMHEAAIIDGASKIQRIRHIDLPSIKGTIVMLLIMRMGTLMSVGFEKVYLLQNQLNYNESLIISTYVYEMGLQKGDYAFSTAIGLFNNVINILLLVVANIICKKVADESLF